VIPRIDLLLLQLLIIVATARILGQIFRAFGQPRVVGEIVAGILLGPTLLGRFTPVAELFPPQSMGALFTLSQFGLILFMFGVGVEVDPGQIKSNGHTALVVSNTSVIVPFVLGMALAMWGVAPLAPPNVPKLGFVLFTGVAMSITAFPVLARILIDCGLMNTRVGSIAIACAAIDDVTAWSVLAVILAIVNSSLDASLAVQLMMLAAYAVIMLFLVRPVLAKLFTADKSSTLLPFAYLLMLASALATEYMGVHALFGAFMAGVVMPRNERVRKELLTTMAISSALLLPVFFAYTGLRANFSAVHGTTLWLYFAAILGVAIVGKFASSMIAARVMGLQWREAIAIGALLNTRGLVELVILNIGYDLSVISQEMFSLMVLMALVTTATTTPVLKVIYQKRTPMGPS